MAPEQAGAPPEIGGLVVAAVAARRKAAGAFQSDAQAGSRHAGQASQSQAKGLGSIRPDRRSRHQRYDLRGAAGPDPLMQKPGGDHREVGERPSRRESLENRYGNSTQPSRQTERASPGAASAESCE